MRVSLSRSVPPGVLRSPHGSICHQRTRAEVAGSAPSAPRAILARRCRPRTREEAERTRQRGRSAGRWRRWASLEEGCSALPPGSDQGGSVVVAAT